MPSLKRILFMAGLLLFIAIVVTYYLFEVNRILQISANIEEREALLRQREESLRGYQEEVAFYKTEEGIEHLAREQYNLAEPGERVFLLVSPDISGQEGSYGR